MQAVPQGKARSARQTAGEGGGVAGDYRAKSIPWQAVEGFGDGTVYARDVEILHQKKTWTGAVLADASKAQWQLWSPSRKFWSKLRSTPT